MSLVPQTIKINVKHCMVREILFCISMMASGKMFGNHCSNKGSDHGSRQCAYVQSSKRS